MLNDSREWRFGYNVTKTRNMNAIKNFFSMRQLRVSLTISLFFSAFIYFFHFGFEFYLLNTLLALYAFYLLIISDRKTLLLSGFFIGLLWFYWVGFSFQYYDIGWAIPFVSVGFALGFALIFWIISWPSHPLLRALMLFLLSLFEPLDFNWLQPELLFIHSYFGIEKWQYAIILLSLSLFVHFKAQKGYLALLLLLPALDFSAQVKHELPLKVSLVQTDIDQGLKWKPQQIPQTVQNNLNAIDQAIQEQKELVILPESAFPLFLNHQHMLLQHLKAKSKEISIVTGSLYEEQGQNFNATYLFQDGKMQIAKKMVLVPFGEYIPLPSFLAEPINKAIFGGTSDFLCASEPTDFKIKQLRIRNAICYEATCHELFKDTPSLMIATSNNAWFMPSIEPSLQRLLMQFYAKKNNTIILHVANGAGGGIVYP